MRWIILALDALEFDLVEKFGLENLMQEEYGEIDLSGFKLIVTPPIWASFITGLMPNEHGVWSIWDRASMLGNPATKIELVKRFGEILLYKFLGTMQFLMYRTHGNEKLFRVLKYTFGYERTDRILARRGMKTIFENVDKSVALNVPTYNWNWDYRAAYFLKKSIENPEGIGRKFEEYIYQTFEKERRDFWNAFKTGDWNLIMAYTKMCDHLGHLYGGNLPKLEKAYIVLDRFAQEIANAINQDDILLIVSDHGMKPLGRFGEHSDHGFYSCNRKLDLETPRITDFFEIILKLFDKEGFKKIDEPPRRIKLRPRITEEQELYDKKDKERILKKLRELGYF